MAIQQAERLNDQQEALRTVLKAFALELWVALPGIVQSYDATRGVVSVQPTIQAEITQGSETVRKNMPVLVDCPVVYQGGGGFVATFPIQAGDECLVIFADRNIDAWWQSGNVSPQAQPRMHSLSDGFALIGPRSLAKAIPNVSTSTSQLRSLDGLTYVEIAGAAQINVVAPGGIKLVGPVEIVGDLSVTGVAKGIGGPLSIDGALTATGEVTAAGIPLSQHIHTGVMSGPDATNEPVA